MGRLEDIIARDGYLVDSVTGERSSSMSVIPPRIRSANTRFAVWVAMRMRVALAFAQKLLILNIARMADAHGMRC